MNVFLLMVVNQLVFTNTFFKIVTIGHIVVKVLKLLRVPPVFSLRALRRAGSDRPLKYFR